MDQKVLITGGSGTLGRAIIQRASEEGWVENITIFSRDPIKQKAITDEFDVRAVTGDVCNFDQIKQAVVGHDIVIHAAAMKHLVQAEFYPFIAHEVNVQGSLNVLEACVNTRVKKVVGISTDKACHPTNVYGATKMLMERFFQKYAEIYDGISFHLVRYGNVVGSTGSFIHNWRKDLEELGHIRSTDPGMTRFWLTEKDAVDLVLLALEQPSGYILIPKPWACSIGDIEKALIPEGTEIERIPVRPGEKWSEILLSGEELWHVNDIGDHYLLEPRTYPKKDPVAGGAPVSLYAIKHWDSYLLGATGGVAKIIELFGAL